MENRFTICIKDHEHLKLKGDLGIDSKYDFKETILISIIKCSGTNCANVKDIDKYINGLFITRLEIYDNINYKISGSKPVQKVVIPKMYQLLSD